MHYTAAEETELAPGSSAKKKYRAPTDRSVEYKYAFGQKIPEHYEWKVKQKHDVQLRKNKNLGFYTEPKQKPKFEIVYDQYGKKHKKQRIKKQFESNLSEIYNEQKEEKVDYNDDCSVVNEAPVEDSPLLLPGWITNPFG